MIGGAHHPQGAHGCEIEPHLQERCGDPNVRRLGAVGVGDQLLSRKIKPDIISPRIRADYGSGTRSAANRPARQPQYLSYETARLPTKPARLGLGPKLSTARADFTGHPHAGQYRPATRPEYIDWTPFFYLLGSGCK